MLSTYRARTKMNRFLLILLSIAIYFFLLTVDVQYLFHLSPTNSPYWLLWMRIGFSAFVALMFLAVGSLIWLYARSRSVAFFLFCFCFMMMLTFTVETGALSHNEKFAAIATVGSTLSLFLLSVLLLIFPKNYLSLDVPSHREHSRSGLLRHSKLLLRLYLLLLALLSVMVSLYSIPLYLMDVKLPNWLNALEYGYPILALTGILITIYISYRQSTLRERQQLRIFLSSIILAVAPFLLFTALPHALNIVFNSKIQRVPEIASELSTLTLSLFPLALGYTILRYQVLVFDRYIRRAVAWIVGSVSLALLAYLVITFSGLFLPDHVSTAQELMLSNEYIRVIIITIAMAVLGPCIWLFAKFATERFFFSDISYYRRLFDRPDLLASETFDLNKASQLLTLAAVNALETREVCLFVLQEDTGYFRLSPTVTYDDPNEATRRKLAQLLLQVPNSTVHKDMDWMNVDERIIERVIAAKRPLLLGEASQSDQELPTGLARYLITTTTLHSDDPLLTPILAQGKLIGILVLGERGDHQQYAGPDFEVISLLLSRFSSVLETARMYEEASRHVAILNTLYSASTMPLESFASIEAVAVAYAKVAAKAVMAGAEIWLCQGKDHLLYRVACEDPGEHNSGPVPQLTHMHVLTPSVESDWSSWFYNGDSLQPWHGSSANVPPCLQQTPCFPIAWIPLNSGQQHLGILALTYARPHIFSYEEKHVLEMFANQCAVSLENTRITIELRAAYKRQKELDQVKDQFIMTASHELRTPLTAVLGYIELLAEYNMTLPPVARADFIAKAHRSCDELTLMVGNIMDASHVQIDAENVNLTQVTLAESVSYVLEILEAMTSHENRTMQVDIPPDILVMADTVRLRQILLNLISNALKYSPLGSGVELTSTLDDEQVTLYVIDHGRGVPLKDQDRLFRRFVRLEQDMNSPVRGAGLGLYISKQLIEAMGGRIWVESSGIPGHGSTFAFTLKRSLAMQEVKTGTFITRPLERQEI